MIDLNKINLQFDIKDIDAAQVSKILIEQQKTIKMVFLIGTLLVGGLMYNDHRSQEAGLHVKMSREQSKYEVIKAHEAAAQDLSHFKSSIPKEISVFDLIRLISNDAKLYNSNIVSYSPSQKKDMGLYDLTNVSFIAESDNFKDMMLFLRKIERSDSPIMISVWSGHEEEDGKISFTTTIGAVHIHP